MLNFHEALLGFYLYEGCVRYFCVVFDKVKAYL